MLRAMRHLPVIAAFCASAAFAEDAAPVAAADAAAPVVAPAEAPVARDAAPVVVDATAREGTVVVAGRSVAVLDLKPGGATEGIAKALTTLVTAEVSSTPGFHAISRNDLKALISHQADLALLGCAEVSCAADIARLANADLVVAGSVERGEGDAVVFSIALIDPATPVVLERQTATWRSNPDDMVELVRPLVEKLLLGKAAVDFKGALEILAPAGAVVVVDDQQLGEAPLKGPVKDLSTGAHHIEVRKSGYVPYLRDVAVAKNETHVVQVDLIDEDSLIPWYQRWYVWGSAVGAVVVVGGTAAAIGTYSYLSQPQPTTLHVAADLPQR